MEFGSATLHEAAGQIGALISAIKPLAWIPIGSTNGF